MKRLAIALVMLAPSVTQAAPSAVLMPSASEDVRLGSCGVELQWTPPSDGTYDGVVILRASGAAPNAAPTSGDPYPVGATVGNATVVYADYGTSSGTVPMRFRDTAALSGTIYYEFYAHDSSLNFASADASGIKIALRCSGATDTSWQYQIGGSLMALPSVQLGAGAYFGSSLDSISGVRQSPAAEQFRPVSVLGIIDQRVPAVPLGGKTYLFAAAEDGYVYAIDAATGQQVWNRDLGAPLTASPSVQIEAYSNAAFQGLGKDLVFVATDNSGIHTGNEVRALNASDGTVAWTYAPGDLDQVMAQPTIDYENNRLYVTSFSNGGTQASVRAISTIDKTETWKTNLGDIDTAPTLTAAGELLVGTRSGSLVSISPSTGMTNWSLALGLTSPVSFGASIAALSGARAVFSVSGHVILVNWTGSPTKVWDRALAGASSPTATPGGTVAWVGSANGTLHEIKLADGTDSGTVNLGASALGQPAVDLTLMRAYVGAASGTLHSVRLPLSTSGSAASGTEICNGLDDNGDGQIDEGFACAVGATRSCAACSGVSGVETCSSGCTWGSCVAPPEECNGVDDTCTGGIDEGFQCGGTTARCTTFNGVPATETCNAATCSFGPPVTCVSPPNTICWNGTGTCASGQCQYTAMAAGTSCTSDQNACTSDICNGNGSCTHPNVADGSSCGSGLVCESGSCVAAPAPAGTLVAYVGQNVPTGWLVANGSCGRTSSSFPDLWNAIGTIYGGSGASDFCLPDLRGRAPLGKSNSGTGSSLGETGGALDQSGTVALGSFTYNFTWTDSITSPFSFDPHTFSSSGALFNYYRYNSNDVEQPDCNCQTGRTGISIGSAPEVATVTSAAPAGTATGSANVDATYSVSPVPFRVVRYIVKAISTAADPVCAVWPSAAASAPSGTVAANGDAASGDVTACLDASFADATPSLAGFYPVGRTSSGTGSTLNGSGGAFSQSATVTLDTASTQASVTLQAPLSASISVTDGSHSVSLSGTRGYWVGGSAVATSFRSATDSNPGRTATTSVSPGLGASGDNLSNAAPAEMVSTNAWSAPYRAVDYRLYAADGYTIAAGTMAAYCGSTIPSGWLKADGSCYPTTTYPGLFSALGYTYGGAGSTFCTPDMTGRMAIGVDSATSAIDTIGKSGGTFNANPSATLTGWTPALIVGQHVYTWSVADNALKLTFNNAPNGAVTGGAEAIQGQLVRGGTWTTSKSNGGNPLTATATIGQKTVTDAPVADQVVALPAQNPPFQAINYIVRY